MHAPDLELAFAAYRERVEEIIGSGDWSAYGDLFTEDAVYRRHGYADFEGREAIRAFIHGSMTTFPGNQIVGFTVVWRIFEHHNDRVVFELRNTMRDPGDGSVHAASTTSMMTYAGDGLWSGCSDLHHARAYTDMVRGWSRAAQAHDTLGADATEFLASLRH